MKIFTVEELQNVLRNLIINEFSYPITIKGEVANTRISPAGHQFFTLRDSNESNHNSINCVLFNGQSNKNIKNYDLSEVLITGNVDMYKANGNCQIKVIDINEYGEGALRKTIEKTRFKLEKEGLFDNKTPIPLYPKTIGIVTSPDSHALHDACSKLNERYPIADVVIYPTLVQGAQATFNIINQLERCNTDKYVDVILLIRGGGSLEDLMVFNDEKLARMINKSLIPVITGIGHQPDKTIADYVADKAMETPTAAAVHATPDQYEILLRIDNARQQMKNSLNFIINGKNEKMSDLKRGMKEYEPNHIVNKIKIEYTLLTTNLKKSMKVYLDNIKSRMKTEKSNLKTKNMFINELMDNTKRLRKNIIEEIINKSRNHHNAKFLKYKKIHSELYNFNPNNVLKKGYSILRDHKGIILKSKEHLAKLETFSAEFSDGRIDVKKVK